MPRLKLELVAPEVEGHMPRKLETGEAPVTVSYGPGEEVKGHVSQEGDGWVLETDQEIEDGTEVTVRFADGGDEVQGHIKMGR